MIVIFEGIRKQPFNTEHHKKNDMKMSFSSNDKYEGQIKEKIFLLLSKTGCILQWSENNVEIYNLFIFQIEKILKLT